MKTKNDWLDWLWQHSITRKDLGPERFQFLTDFYQYDRIAPIVIGITGTNGKGSVAKLLESIYAKQGYSTACMTSPHIHEFNERLTFDGIPVSDACLVDGFERIQHLLGEDVKFNAYDVVSLVQFDLIHQSKVDVAIVECGIGAMLDSIAALALDVSVITSIALDHTHLFGNSREQIAFNKAHIARAGGILICGEPDPPEVIAQVATEIGAHCQFINTDFSYVVPGSDHWRFESATKTYEALPKPEIKLQNAATALAVVNALDMSLPVSMKSMTETLQQFKLPGRFERVQSDCELFFDVAANPEATRWLRSQLSKSPCSGKTHFILGVKSLKDLHMTLEPMADFAAQWYIAPLPDGTGYPVETIAQELAALGVENCYTGSNVSHHLKGLMPQVAPHDRIVIFGSFQVVAEAKSCIEELTDGITT